MTATRRAEPGSDLDRRKRDGVFYTPLPVARYLAAASLRDIRGNDVQGNVDPDSAPGMGMANQPFVTEDKALAVLDPACGDGALLWPAYQALCDQQHPATPLDRLELVRRQLFGVDLDEQAVDRLRQRFFTELAQGASARSVHQVLRHNFRSGNAVSGRGWESSDGVKQRDLDSTLFHWHEQFPQVCDAGGFDLVIANPPYRRERGAKSDRTALENSPLTRVRRQARMDLWHYFFHRSLDLLRPGGMLTFIVNSYWTTSAAGRPLVERMAAETTPLEFILLDRAPVFAGVFGRHLIVRLRKGLTGEWCRAVTLDPAHHARVLNEELWAEILGSRSTIRNPLDATEDHSPTSQRQPVGSGDQLPAKAETFSTPTRPFTIRELPRDELFQQGKLCLERSESDSADTRIEHSHPVLRLGDIFEVRQGIAENPPRVTRRQSDANPALRTGEGVFVLSADELAALDLSPTELQVIRPYYSAAEITRFWPMSDPRQWLLYLTRQTAPELEAMPRIARHLARFRNLLDQRREVLQEKIAWWHLHWPRESRLFEKPRILAVQMVERPRFAYVEQPTYVGFSVNLVVASEARPADANWPLETLAAVLNSTPAAAWFDRHAKRRGVHLDITGSALKQFPLPTVDAATLDELTRLARSRRELERRLHENSAHHVAASAETRDLGAAEISAVELQIDELLA